MSGEERAQAEAWVNVVSTALQVLAVIVPDAVEALTGEQDPEEAIEAAREAIDRVPRDLVDKWNRDLEALDD